MPGAGEEDRQQRLDENNPRVTPNVPPAIGRLDTGEWSPERTQVYNWLADKAPGLAPVYAALVRMAMDPDFPGRVWLMAHSLREIRNRLPNAVAGVVKGERTEYSELAAEVTRCWIEDGLPPDGTSPLAAATDPTVAGPRRVEVSEALVGATGGLVAGHQAIEPRKQVGARRLFVAITGGPVPEYAVKAWLSATGRAEKFAHLRDKPLTTRQQQEFELMLAACERALMSIANRSFENMDALDEILAEANA